MIGQAISTEGKKYNIIILAGGNGTRMGEQSEFIPKALSQLGNKRAIDYIIERYTNVAHKFIIGTCKHADLLETYVNGRFPNLNIEFSRETELVNNAISTMYCLDHADTRYGTIITFCDLILFGVDVIYDDTVMVTTSATRGVVGTFRHTATSYSAPFIGGMSITRYATPVEATKGINGILGTFILSNTKRLKGITYTLYNPTDLTWDIIAEYGREPVLSSGHPISMSNDMIYCEGLTPVGVNTVFEFGTETDLQKVRELWEDA